MLFQPLDHAADGASRHVLSDVSTYGSKHGSLFIKWICLTVGFEEWKMRNTTVGSRPQKTKRHTDGDGVARHREVQRAAVVGLPSRR